MLASVLGFLPDVFLPFIAAVFYCFSIMLVKCASRSGTLSGVSMLVMNNLLSGLVFAPCLLFCGLPQDLSLAWQPLLVGALCAAGNIATFICAERGEISLMTPIMGVKMLFVIILAGALLDVPLPRSIVVAGAMCCVAVFIMGFSRRSLKSSKAGFSVVLALMACAFYAACDVLIQKFSADFSACATAGFMTIAIAASVLPLVPRFLREARASSAGTLALGGASAAFMVLEMFIMVLAISGDIGASLCNILYNTRGIMAIVFVYVLGRRFAVLRELSGASALQRCVGAALILAAVAIVLR